MMVDSKIALEFVGTECLRPEVCERSWESFHSRLKGVDWPETTLFLNIDPVPPNRRAEAGRLIKAARRFFGRVEVNQPDQPNFARAVKWGWAQPQRAAFFYLQADWILQIDVDVPSLMPFLENWDAVNLRAYRSDWGPKHLCLSPVLIRTDVARQLAGRLTDEAGPEAQLRAPYVREGGRSLGLDIWSLHWPTDRDRCIIEDIGRPWMTAHGLKKKGGKSFVTWEFSG